MLLTEDSDLVGSLSVENVIIVTQSFLLVLTRLIDEEKNREDEDTGGCSQVDTVGSLVEGSVAIRSKRRQHGSLQTQIQ